MARLIPNLGEALSPMIRAEVRVISHGWDVEAWGAPGECHLSHAAVESICGEAEAEAERIAGEPLDEILRQAKERGAFEPHSPRWNEAVGRRYARHGFPG